MGQYELKGVLYPNGYKTKSSQPDHTGKATIAGVCYRIAAWENEGSYMNMQFTIIEEDGVKVEPDKHDKHAKPTGAKPIGGTGTGDAVQDTGAPPWDDDDDDYIPF